MTTRPGWWRAGLGAVIACGLTACGAARPGAAADAADAPLAAQQPSTQQPSARQPGTQQPGTQQPGAAEPAPPSGASRADGAPSSPPPTPALERSYTGQERPTVEVENGFPHAQHVFVDARELGRVEPGASATFEVPVGAHTFTCADSADPNDNPSSVTEPFESGYLYRYAIRAR